MSDTKSGRPAEIHISTVDAIDVDAMTLITSVAYGERHVSKMINMLTLGMVNPGFHRGFNPKPGGGLKLIIEKDTDAVSVAIVEIAGRHIHIFQQHDATLTLLQGYLNVVVLEGFYEEGVSSSQVSSDSSIPPARLRRVLSHEVTSEHLIVCEVDLTDSPTAITTSDISLAKRTTCTIAMPVNFPEGQLSGFHRIQGDSDTLVTNRVNLITGDYECVLPKSNDDTMIDIDILFSESPSTFLIKLNAPAGEKIFSQGSAYDLVPVVGYKLRLYRVDGAWAL